MLRKKVYGLWIFGGLSLAILPLFLDTGIIRILVFANLYAILAMSWDIFSGHTGYISFGHSFLAGTAAYTSSLLNYHLGLPLFVSMPLAIIATLVLGMLLFFPALRLRGSYFTLITLLLSVVAVQFVKIFSQYTGGDRGLTPISTIASGAIANFYVTLAFMLIIALGLSGKHRDEALAAGANAFINKLGFPEQLLETVDEVWTSDPEPIWETLFSIEV